MGQTCCIGTIPSKKASSNQIIQCPKPTAAEIDLPFGSTNICEYWKWVKEIGLDEFNIRVMYWSFVS